MTTSVKMNQYKEWAARIIIGVILFIVTVSYNSIRETRAEIGNKVDKDVFDDHCKRNELKFKEMDSESREMRELLIEIKMHVLYLRKHKEGNND